MNDVDLMQYIKTCTKIGFNSEKMLFTYTLDYPMNNSMHSVVLTMTTEERNELMRNSILDIDEQVHRSIFEYLKTELRIY